MEKDDKSLVKQLIKTNAQNEDKRLSEQELRDLDYAQRVEEAKGSMVMRPDLSEEKIQEILQNIKN